MMKGPIMSNQSFLQHIRNIGDSLPGWTGWLKPRNEIPQKSLPALRWSSQGCAFAKGRTSWTTCGTGCARSKMAENTPVTASCGCCSSPFCHWRRVPIQDCCKMRTVLRGLYGSKVSFLYLTAGIFQNHQSPFGIVQCYGVSAFASTLEEACAQSRRSLAALKGAMSGAYRQIRLKPLTIRLAEWIFLSFHDMKHVLLTVGHTDPRRTPEAAAEALSTTHWSKLVPPPSSTPCSRTKSCSVA